MAFAEEKKSRLAAGEVERIQLEAEKSALEEIVRDNAEIIEKLEEEMARCGLTQGRSGSESMA